MYNLYASEITYYYIFLLQGFFKKNAEKGRVNNRALILIVINNNIRAYVFASADEPLKSVWRHGGEAGRHGGEASSISAPDDAWTASAATAGQQTSQRRGLRGRETSRGR